MQRLAIVSVFGILALFAMAISQAARAADDAGKPDSPAALPADRVVVMYFHRTVRCPTCKRMGSLAEEAVLKGLPVESPLLARNAYLA